MTNHALLTNSIDIDIDDVVDLRNGKITTVPTRIDKPELLYLLTSVEADGSNAVQWSSDGTEFHELDSFTDVIRFQPSDVLGIRFIKVTGAASSARITITQL